MNKFLLFPILCFAFLSCKKHHLNSLLDRDNTKALTSVPVHPSDFCKEGNPIGGGEGYTDIVHFSLADVIISSPMSATSFKTLIESSANKIIYINSNVTIDLTGLTQTIYLPSNIIIASDRGVGGSLGALIKTNNFCPYNNTCSFPVEVFTANGNNIRITGVQLKGPYSGVGNNTLLLSRICILMKGYDGLELDNCELSAWPEAGVSIGRPGAGNQSNNNNMIHHNSIHDNKQTGLGYGIVVDNGFAYIQSNVFQYDRHDIACSGARNSNNTGYEASCNIILQGGTEHNFDIHGESGDNLPNASTFFYIHHNYFIDIGTTTSRPGNAWMQNIGVRGIPDNQCRIENNIFRHDGPANAIRQGSSKSTPFSVGNLLVWNNVYGYNDVSSGSYLGWYVKPTWSKKGVSNFMDLMSTNTNLLSSIGDPNVIDYALGDYNGDGKTDVYKIHNGALYVMPYKITNGLTQGWTQLITTTYLMNQLRFGHYNSDNVTDMIVRDGNNIYVSYGCNSSWVLLNTTTYPMSSIYSGDLTGDGIEDFFCASGGSWMMIDNATPNSSWVTIINRNENSSVLRLGWFDLNTANNKIDVFLGNGVNFLSAYDGTQGWTVLSSSTYTTPYLSVYDFDSDGVSDVILNSTRQISLKGRITWANSTLNNFPLSSFTYGDL